MKEELSIDNILSEEDVNNLFTPDEGTEAPKEEEKPSEENNEESKEGKEKTAEVDTNNLFTQSESVGSGENMGEGTQSSEGDSSNFFSSIARALVDEGVFPDIDNDTLSKVSDADGFKSLIEQTIQDRFDERQKRVDEALNVGVAPNDIQRYETYINALDNLSQDTLSQESEQGENLRKNLIYQDYINRGFSKERAEKEVDRSLKNGTDIDDAKEALESNKDFYRSQYKELIEAAKQEAAAQEAQARKEVESLRKSILEDAKFIGDVDLDKGTRQKIFDSIMKPVYKDPETGEMLTAIQRYSKENKADFIKNLGYLWVMTDGFKNLGNIINGQVKKGVKKGLRELEQKLSNTSRNSNGSLKFVGDSDRKSSFRNWDIDI